MTSMEEVAAGSDWGRASATGRSFESWYVAEVGRHERWRCSGKQQAKCLPEVGGGADEYGSWEMSGAAQTWATSLYKSAMIQQGTRTSPQRSRYQLKLDTTARVGAGAALRAPGMSMGILL